MGYSFLLVVVRSAHWSMADASKQWSVDRLHGRPVTTDSIRILVLISRGLALLINSESMCNCLGLRWIQSCISPSTQEYSTVLLSVAKLMLVAVKSCQPFIPAHPGATSEPGEALSRRKNCTALNKVVSSLCGVRSTSICRRPRHQPCKDFARDDTTRTVPGTKPLSKTSRSKPRSQ